MEQNATAAGTLLGELTSYSPSQTPCFKGPARRGGKGGKGKRRGAGKGRKGAGRVGKGELEQGRQLAKPAMAR